jgi:Xaa-Pro dipeptidase
MSFPTNLTKAGDADFAQDELAGRRHRLAASLAEQDLGAAVVSDPRDVEYFTGVDPVTALTPNPFTGPLAVALILSREGEAVVVGAEPDLTIANMQRSGIRTATCDTFEDLTALRPRTRLGETITSELASMKLPASSRLGIEPSAVPGGLLDVLGGSAAMWRFGDIEPTIAAQRAKKSPQELSRIRAAIAVCDRAQHAAGQALAAGAQPEDVEHAIRASLQSSSNEPIPALVEASTRSELDPATRQAPTVSLVITDIAPRLNGYWGDSCDTRPMGHADSRSTRVIEAVTVALRTGLDAIRPGIQANQLDAAMRQRVAQAFPAYTGAGGHGIGLDYHEHPRLIPDDTTVLEPDMVLALEPGAYFDDVAVRLEVVVRVVPSGCEVLSTHLARLGIG